MLSFPAFLPFVKYMKLVLSQYMKLVSKLINYTVIADQFLLLSSCVI